MSSLRALQRYAQAREPAPHSVCELCGARIGDQHRHVVDLRKRSLGCACEPCAFLFSRNQDTTAQFRTVPDRVIDGSEHALTDADWSALQIPVQLAFFFFSSPLSRWVGVYPGAAGATESELPLERWQQLAKSNLLVASVEPDVEAVLARAGKGDARFECLLVPIDLCYELVGLVRKTWRGFDGGDELRRTLDSFFARLRARSRRLPTRGGA